MQNVIVADLSQKINIFVIPAKITVSLSAPVL